MSALKSRIARLHADVRTLADPQRLRRRRNALSTEALKRRLELLEKKLAALLKPDGCC